jgi:trypsin
VTVLKKYTVHEKYDTSVKKTFLNDIALLELEKPLTFNKAVQPIPIAPSGIPSSGKLTYSMAQSS